MQWGLCMACSCWGGSRWVISGGGKKLGAVGWICFGKGCWLYRGWGGWMDYRYLMLVGRCLDGRAIVLLMGWCLLASGIRRGFQFVETRLMGL